MATILMALSLGAVSMIIVFLSGFISGAVRLGTLSFRGFIAFCVTSVLTYLLLRLFEMYDERRRLQAEAVEKALAEDEEKSAEEKPSDDTTPGNFQPTNPSDYPQA